ncbi:MAG: hypothetical protein ACFB0B_18485 [Thermonemataceae bacterium]
MRSSDRFVTIVLLSAGAIILLYFSGVFTYIQNFFIKETLVETFDDNRNNWPQYKKFDFQREIKKGKYTFSAPDRTGSPYSLYDYINVDFPSHYRIELAATCTKKGGERAEYGFYFVDEERQAIRFFVDPDDKNVGYKIIAKNPNAQVNQFTRTNKFYVKEEDKKYEPSLKFDGRSSNIQQLVVKDNQFKYVVNNELKQEGAMLPHSGGIGIDFLTWGHPKMK